MERWERREQKKQSQRSKMPKHGKTIGKIYKDVVEKNA
jgi:hypothetical protein